MSGRTSYDWKDVKPAARGHWPAVLNRIAGIGDEFLGGRQGPCPKCNGTERWRVFADFNETGGAVCNQCGKFSDGAAVMQWFMGVGFPEVVDKIGEFLGVAKKTSGKQATGKRKGDPGKNLEPSPWARPLAALWGMRKKPITPEGVQDVGGRIARYRKQHTVIAIPVLGQSLDPEKPVGWVIYSASGGTLPVFHGKGKPIEQVKMKTTSGSDAGLILTAALLEALRQSVDLSAETIWKLEGPGDLMAFASLKPGVHAFTNSNGAGEAPKQWIIDALKKANVQRVRVIHDCDTAGQEGAVGRTNNNGKFTPGWANALATVVSDTRNVRLPYDIQPSHGRDLRDWLNEGGSVDAISDLPAEEVKAVAPATKTDAAANDGRDCIVLTDNERMTVKQTIAALAGDQNLFTKGGRLVDVIELPHPDEPEEVVLQVRKEKPLLDLRATITDKVRFVVETEDGPKPRTIPRPLPGQVAAAGEYPGIRPLTGFIEHPFLRQDCSVCTDSGYDPATRMLVRSDLQLEIPDRPTRDDAIVALDQILDLLVDFPFKQTYHRSAWVAGLLTLFARYAINGPVPLWLIEASTQGSGKSRLVDLLSIITTGRLMVRSSWPGKDEEVEKRITTFCLAGLPMVLFDNAKATLGGQAIEAVATSTSWKGRFLGESRETPEMPMRITFVFTSNNASMTPDFARRACVCRLEPLDDKPDQRSGFRHTDLLAHAAAERPKLVTACLTILKAFVESGASPKMKQWGSFERWSDLIRGALLWLDQSDPIEGMIAAKQSETAEDCFPATIAALIKAGLPLVEPNDANAEGWTAGKVKDELERFSSAYGAANPDLADAVQSAAGDKKITAIRIGKIFHRYEGRIFDGKQFFSSYDNHRKQKIWCIRLLDAGSAGNAGSETGPRVHRKEEGSTNGEKESTQQPQDYPQLPASPATAESSLPAVADPPPPSADCSEGHRHVDDRLPDGRIRTTCGRCGKFIGNRWPEVARC